MLIQRRALRTIGLFTIALVLGLGTSSRGLAVQEAGAVLDTFTLPEFPLAQLQSDALPEHPIADDRGMLLGGIGSDLWRAPEDPAGEYWMVTDRGPNGQIEVDGANRRTFPVPDFSPLILHVSTAAGEIEILEALPILGQSGAPVTGLSNLDGPDEKPYDYSATEELPYNPSGLDTEGLVRAADGTFWLVDEYSPSLLHVDGNGVVIQRYLPEGVDLAGADYPVSDTLPGIFANRKGHRGFEGLALSPDGTTLVLALQSPLSVPDKDTGENSLNTRILAVSASSGEPTAEYVYQFEEATDFDPDPEVVRDAMKLSGLVAIDADTLLVLERTDAVAKLFTVDLSTATNILGGLSDDPASAPSLEATDNLLTSRIVPLPKSLLIDLSTVEGMPGKIEGVAVIDDTTVAVANDNDFDIGDFDADGRHLGEGKTSQILVVQTPSISGNTNQAGTPAATPEASPAATPVAAAPDRVAVEIINDRYAPRAVEIAAGTGVRWVNRDGVTHTVSAVDDQFDSGIMRRGAVFTETFDTPGVYRYGCDLHLEMYGTVLVR